MSYLDAGERQRPTTANSEANTIVASHAPSENIEMSDAHKKHASEQVSVDVQEAEAQFNALARRLTWQSTKHHEKSGDVEKQETFDLLDYLRTTSSKQDDVGFAKKHVGVAFENLRVTGTGGVKICERPHIPDSVKEFFLSPYYIVKGLLGGPEVTPKTILHLFNGAVRPGEMVLVLGRPGAGCSFLKTIGNQRGSFIAVDGDVQYAGFRAEEFGKQYAGQAAYSMEDGIHYPILSVAQTLQFALKLKSPGRLIPEQTRADLNDEVLSTLLSMLNIARARNTVVGNEFASRAVVYSWDNSTRGLDASTALDYAKSLRIMTDIFKLTTFVSLYQAGEGIYDQLNKVLLIDEGRQVYFGPAKEARNCTNPNDRAFADGRSEAGVPSTPGQFAQAFQQSNYWATMISEHQAMRAEWRREANDPSGTQEQFLQVSKEEKRKHVSRKDPHICPLGCANNNGYPITSIRILLFSIIIYFMCVDRNAGAFFTFYLFIYTTFLAMTAFFRLESSEPRFRLHDGERVLPDRLQCVGNYIVPRNIGNITKYPTELGPNQACTLLGASSGESLVTRDAYMWASFDYRKKDIWCNFGILVLFWVGIVVLQVFAMEKLQHGVNARAITIYAKETKENKELNGRLPQRKAAGRKAQDSDSVSGATTKSTSSKAFTWENFDYTVPIPGGTRRLLNKVFDYVKSGTLTALMGSSGAGKTTLLVGEVIALLEMEEIADAMIGQPGVGLGIEARKRVTISVELAAKPQLLLLLDEPTSGLDGQSAYNIVRLLKKLAAAGQAILQHLVRYLAERGVDRPPDANLAEYVLEGIGAGSRIGPTDWAELWRQSPNFEEVKGEIWRIKEKAAQHPPEADPKADQEYVTPFTRLLTHGVIAPITSLTFLKLGSSTQELQYRVFAIFQASVMPAIIISQVEPMFIMARMIFIRESSSRMYSQITFALGQLMTEMPYSFLYAVTYFVSFYFPAGSNTASDPAGYHFFMTLVTEIFSVTLGQMLAVLTPSVYIISLLNPFILFPLFCGVTNPKASVPAFWRAWLYHLDPFTRLSHFWLGHHRVTRSPKYLAGDFVNTTVSYPDNPSATADCRYCPYSVGDDFYVGLDLSFDTRWRDLGIMVEFIVFNIIVTLIASKLFKFAER
ncbi:hypothetical protein FRC11_007050 [Ceratobasidium sp. 423]|nr:hypothetical protein FRC11_007050 [Ceratobasidium sp. 423]